MSSGIRVSDSTKDNDKMPLATVVSKTEDSPILLSGKIGYPGSRPRGQTSSTRPEKDTVGQVPRLPETNSDDLTFPDRDKEADDFFASYLQISRFLHLGLRCQPRLFSFSAPLFSLIWLLRSGQENGMCQVDYQKRAKLTKYSDFNRWKGV